MHRPASKDGKGSALGGGEAGGEDEQGRGDGEGSLKEIEAGV